MWRSSYFDQISGLFKCIFQNLKKYLDFLNSFQVPGIFVEVIWMAFKKHPPKESLENVLTDFFEMTFISLKFVNTGLYPNVLEVSWLGINREDYFWCLEYLFLINNFNTNNCFSLFYFSCKIQCLCTNVHSLGGLNEIVCCSAISTSPKATTPNPTVATVIEMSHTISQLLMDWF